MGGDGIISGAVVENNSLQQRHWRRGGINMDGIVYLIGRNVCFTTTMRAGSRSFNKMARSAANDQFLNNTIVMGLRQPLGITIPGASCINNRLFNNILTPGTRSGAVFRSVPGRSPGSERLQRGDDRFTTDDGDSRLTLALRQALGNDTHSRIAPGQLFVSPGSDFHLKVGSAIDAGRRSRM